MSPLFRTTLLWVFGSVIIVLMSLSMVSGAYVDGHYIPSNPDAFYHARRILDSVMTHAPIMQFDPYIHAPEGSWITWPWGFDALLAGITRLFGPFNDEFAAARVLMNVPVAFGPLAVGLVVLLARQLRLSALLAVILVLGFAALPLVFMLFAVGNVDHHFAEMLWALATLSATIWWFDAGTPRAALVLALVLGSAVAIQNGLFILQLVPLLVAGWRWLRRESLPARGALLLFAVALPLITLCACVPSQPWRAGFFEFYTLSWFHVYIAACTSGVVALLAVLPKSARNLAIVGGIALLAAVPIVASMNLASRFVSGGLESVQGVSEAMSPYENYFSFGPEMSTLFTSWFMWLALPAMLLNAYWAWRASDPRLQSFALPSVLLLALYQLQFRFGPLGTFSLLATPLLAAQALSTRFPARAPAYTAGAALLFVIAFIPTRTDWPESWAHGGDPVYDRVRPVFPALEQACARAPGIVLAPINDGHWVRYHTSCAVIGNVFLLTEQHAQKRRETEQLLGLTPRELLASRPDVRYVLANFQVDVGAPAGPGLPEQPDIEMLRGTLGPLMATLLGPSSAVPPEFHLLVGINTPAGRPYTRLYEIVRAPRTEP